MTRYPDTSRRRFLGTLTGTAALAAAGRLDATSTTELLSRSDQAAPVSANDRMQIGLIGAGIQGVEDTNAALTVTGTKVVAVCDLYTGRLTRAKERWGADLFTSRDYRELLARPDVDAVIIATPDHWHRQISVDALEAKKPAYCEKPMVQTLGEGEAIIAAQKKTGVAFQVGSQGISSVGNEKARELLAAGAIGKLVYAEGFWARNSPMGAWQYPIPQDASPETVDWDRFLGQAPKRPYDPIRFFRWRNYRDYGTGVTGDLFVHLFTSLHFITNSLGPTSVMATGGLRFWQDGRDAADVMLGMFDYPETPAHPAFNLSLRCNFVDGTSGSTYLRLVGTDGSMDVEWERIVVRKNKVWDPKRAIQKEYMHDPEPEPAIDRGALMSTGGTTYIADPSYKGAHHDHFAHFFNTIRGREQAVVEDAVFGYRAAAPALACNLSYYEKRAIGWDPVAMKVVPAK
jgi:predicted dehydrogenase